MLTLNVQGEIMLIFICALLVQCSNDKIFYNQNKVSPLVVAQSTQIGLAVAEKTGIIGLIELAALPISMPVDHLIHNIKKWQHLKGKGKDNSSLLSAIQEDNFILVEDIIKKRQVELNQRNEDGVSFLDYAIAKGNASIVKTLVEGGVNVNSQNPLDKTPLRLAVESGNLNIVRYLLSQGANPMLVDNNGNNVLHIAAIMGREDICKALIDTGHVHVRVENKMGSIPLHFAALSSKVSLGQYLIDIDDSEENPSYTMEDQSGIQPIHLAALSGNTSLLKRILAKNKELATARTKNGATPLHFLCLGNFGGKPIRPAPYKEELLLIDFMPYNTDKLKLEEMLSILLKDNQMEYEERLDNRGMHPPHYAVLSNNQVAIKNLLRESPNIFLNKVEFGTYSQRTKLPPNAKENI